MSCVGKNLALAQLRLVAALVLTKYKLNFVDGNGELVEDDMKDQLTANPGKLMLQFEPLK